MAQPYESLSARLGGALGKGLSEGAAGLSGSLTNLISQRINRLEQDRVQEQQRQNKERGISAMLPEVEVSKAKDLSFAPESLLRDYLKNVNNASAVADLQRMFSPDASVSRVGNQMGAPASIQSGMQEPEIQEALPRTQAAKKALAETLRQEQPTQLQAPQAQPQQERLEQPLQQAYDKFNIAPPRQELGKLGINSPQEQQNFMQNMEKAPINPNLSPEQKFKAATYWAALNEISNNQKKALENPTQIPDYLAASGIVNGNAQSIKGAYTNPRNSITPEQYLNAQRQRADAQKQGRLWNQPYIEEGRKTKEKAQELNIPISGAQALIRSGAPTGVTQVLANALNIPISARDTRIEILDKIYNDIVVKSADGRGRMTNMLLGYIAASKGRIINSPKAAEFILDSYDYVRASNELRGNVVENMLEQWGNQPLPQNWWVMAQKEVDQRRQELDRRYAEQFKKNFNIDLQPSPYDLSDDMLSRGILKQTEIQNGTVFNKNNEPYIMINNTPVKLQKR